MGVGEVVNKLIRNYKTRNPFEIAERQNIHVMFANLPESVRGMAVKALKQRYIVLNENMHRFMQRAVCAHELGHHNLHPGSSYRFIDEYSLFLPGRFEREANEFAATLLIDERLIEKRDTYSMIAAKAEIPIELVGYYKPLFDGTFKLSNKRIGFIKWFK